MVHNNLPVIVAAKRTAIGGFGGTLSSIPSQDLGAAAIGAALESADINPASIDEVFMGCVVSAGVGQKPTSIPGRYIARAAF